MDRKLPTWFKQPIPDTAALETAAVLSEFKVNTVCKEAKCPNFSVCFNDSRLTFMILGDVCTRDCGFCSVNKFSDSRSLNVDPDEPYRISQLVRVLGIDYAVITSVTRDDLKDGGAAHFAKTIESIKGIDRDIKIEVLIPDFSGSIASLKAVIDAGPNVMAHNIETVKRLYKEVRPKADYRRCLDVLGKIKELSPSLITKSSIMLGLGETAEEVIDCMGDLRHSQCDVLTLGQYLAPSIHHYPVKDFIDIGQFHRYRDIGLSLGFKVVLSGPLVRSSYKAEEVYNEIYA